MQISSGEVTFLFTDIEGSTKLAQEFPEQLPAAIEIHNSILSKAVESNNGYVFEIIGDAFCCSFEKAEDAIKAAVDAQLDLSRQSWNDAEIKIRIGIHSGIAEWAENRYMGYITLARSARVMSCGYGEQIIISYNTYELVKDKFNSGDTSNISFLDLGERRMKDVIQPIRLFQVQSPGLREDFPPLKTLDARPNNLPIQLTSFIGREKEITDLKNLFSDKRLITLLGPGGAGKSRLSLQVAADLIDQFINGVWLVEIAPLQESENVVQAIVSALGINDQTNPDPEISLINYLKEKELIIILDNCEHLIEVCAGISDKILRNCPKVKIITTSREPLRSEGEQTYKVLSLAHPNPNESNTIQELTQFEAVRLFIERALSVNAGFRVNNENAPALAQICYQLDGIPFAIELAAARIRILPVEKICEKLNDRFKLLTGGKRTALPRQQTLRALIDWSYDILSDNEKMLLQRLSVFSGGWTLEAAEEICSDDEIDNYEIMDINSNLLDKSLINATETNDSFRFYMLESIREYAKEKFADNSELRIKHYNYYKNLFDYERLNLQGSEKVDRIRLIESELDNIRSANQWALENDPEKAYGLVVGMGEFFQIKGLFKEGYQTCIKVLNNKHHVDEYLKARVLDLAGVNSNYLGNLIDAEKYLNEALSIFRKLNKKYEIANCLNSLGVVKRINSEKSHESMEHYQEAIKIFRELDAKKDIGTALFNMSFTVDKKANPGLDREYKAEALKIFRELNDTSQISLCLSNLGVVEFKNNNFEKARTYSEESLALAYRIGDKYLISANLVNLGCVHLGLKQYDKAYELLDESVAITKENGYMGSYLVALMYQGEVASKLGDDDRAIKLFEESIKTGDETSSDFYHGSNYYNLGISYYNLKDYENSLKYFLKLKNIYGTKEHTIDSEKMKIAEEYILAMSNEQ